MYIAGEFFLFWSISLGERKAASFLHGLKVLFAVFHDDYFAVKHEQYLAKCFLARLTLGKFPRIHFPFLLLRLKTVFDVSYCSVAVPLNFEYPIFAGEGVYRQSWQASVCRKP